MKTLGWLWARCHTFRMREPGSALLDMHPLVAGSRQTVLIVVIELLMVDGVCYDGLNTLAVV